MSGSIAEPRSEQAIESALCRHAGDTLIVFANFGLLGDKVTYEVLLRAAVESSSGFVVAVEGVCDQMSFADYPVPADAVLQLFPDQWTMPLRALLPPPHPSLREITLIDHDSWPVGRSLMDAGLLWGWLRTAAERGHYPSLQVPLDARERATALLTRNSVGAFAALHVRSLPRGVHKNVELQAMLQFAEALVRTLDIDIVWLGVGDSRPTIQGNRFLDVLPLDLDVWTSAGLLVASDLFVGGDSGPLHLAAAVGARCLALSNGTKEKFGPFAPQSQLKRVPQGASVEEFVGCARQLLSRPRQKPGVGSLPRRRETTSPLCKPRNPQDGRRYFAAIGSETPLREINAAYDKLWSDVDIRYFPVRVASLKRGISALAGLGFTAFSISSPFKEDAVLIADHALPHCADIGAANTLYFDGRYWLADNTDWEALALALGDEVDGTAVVFGCGGVARASAYALQRRGIRTLVVSRNELRGRALCSRFGTTWLPSEDLASIIDSCTIFVNATPVPLPTEVTEAAVVKRALILEWRLNDNSAPRVSARYAKYVDGWQLLRSQAVRQVQLMLESQAAAG